MEEKYIKFLNFNWSDSEEWKQYFTNLSDIPRTRDLVMHFRKRFYKFKIDPDFDDKYDPNDKNENKNHQFKEKNKRIGIFDNIFASLEGLIWVAYFFNMLMHINVIGLSLLAILFRIVRTSKNLFLRVPKLNKEYFYKFLLDKNIQLLIYISIIITETYINYLLLFPISITAFYCICDYFANYLRIFEFVKKYFSQVIKAKNKLDSIIGFSFVLIGIYMIPAGLIKNWISMKISLFFWIYLLFLFYFNDDVKTTGIKIRNFIELFTNSNRVPLIIKRFLKIILKIY